MFLQGPSLIHLLHLRVMLKAAEERWNGSIFHGFLFIAETPSQRPQTSKFSWTTQKKCIRIQIFKIFKTSRKIHKIIKSPSSLDLFQPFPYVFFKGSRLGHASLELCHMQPQGRAVGLRSVAELRHQATQGAVHRCGLRGQQLQMQILQDMKQLQVYHYVCVLYMVYMV